MMEGIIQSKSKTFFVFCFCFLFGVAVASFWNKNFIPAVWYILFVLLFFLVISFSRKPWRFTFISLLCILCGFIRFSVSLPTGDKEISRYNGQKQTLIGYVILEPDLRQDGLRYVLAASQLESGAPLSGRVYFKNDLYPRYQYGDKLKVFCSLQAPEPVEDFRYDMYLAKMQVFSVCANPKIEKIGEGGGNILLTQILRAKGGLANRISNLWHEPYASFVAGILYGYRGGLGTLAENFSRTGVTHIVAISGYNIALIATIFSQLLVYLLIPRKKAFFVVVSGIIVFVLFTGASASVVRTGIMGIIVLMAGRMGRKTSAFGSIVFASTLMTLHNPYVLLFDAGFHLSVLATLGLVYLSPLVEKRLQFVPSFLKLRENLSTTLSAIIITLPLILYQFGRLSVVAPVVNLLILPGIPIAMMLGAATVVADYIFFPLARLLSFVTYLVLLYIVKIVEWFSSFRFASVEIKIPLWLMVVSYGFILWLITRVQKNNKIEFK